ncbi:PAS domain S-box protein [Segetibacter koreensis]|uniref:PAS domain S-box protein n=1 Tax=Segetibacter koreensis TaxID=398037 RepID=UPI0003660D76|nr:PAS domain S-box protein [Segetibacter koreensis]
MSINPTYENNHWEDICLLKAAFACSSDNIFIIDPQLMKIVDANKTALTSLGYTKKELLELGPADVDGNFTSEMIATLFTSVLTSKEQYAIIPTVFKRKDKTVINVTLCLRAFIENKKTFILASANDGNHDDIKGTVSVIKDIDEIKKKDDQITYLAGLVNKVNDAIISVGKNYNIVSWNKGAESIYGFEEKEVIGKSIFNLWMSSNPYWRREEILTILQKKGCWVGEIKHYHKNNFEKWTLVSATVLKNELAIITGFVVVAKDITTRKALEQELKELNDRLEHRVKDKTEEVVSIFERITDGFVGLDNNWNFTYVNREASRIHGKETKEMIGKNIWKEFPEVINHTFYYACCQAMEEQKVVQVQDYYPPLNKWLEGSIYPSANGLSIYFRDITNNKKAELALKESQERFRKIVETLQEGIWQIDENNITLFVNEYLASLLGHTVEEMIGRNAFDFLYKEDMKKALNSIEERKRGISKLHELTFYNHNNLPIHTLVQSTPIFKDGKYAGSISTLLNITERKQAEQRVIARKRRFRALLENSSDGIVLLSSKGIILYISPSAEKMLGYTKEEMVGTDRLNYFHPDDKKTNFDFFANIINNPQGVKQLELRCRLGDGSYKYIECKYTNSLNDPNINAIIANFRDITERKKAEKQLQQNEEQLSLIYNSTLNAMWLLKVEENGKYRYEAVNTAYTTLIGIKKEEAIGKNFGEVIPLRNIDKFTQAFSDAIALGQIIKFITCNELPSGLKTAEVTIIPIKNEEKKVTELLVTANDITEQKKSQEELLQMNKQLRELASHLQNIREEERTKMAREIHDELGQQLTVLKMDISWLNKKIPTRDENVDLKIKGMLELIDGTINSVRKISTELRPSILDNLGLADAIEWQSNDFTRHTGIPVEFSSNVSDNKFSPDISIGVFRILQESLTNVARHAHATKVICRLEKFDNFLNLFISDNGSGFDVTKKGERKTLGLLGMKERVAMLNGKYNIASEPGKGTEVSVQISLI